MEKRWSEIKHLMRPTQAALGWDWCFAKLKNFSTPEAAQKHVAGKPIPYVRRGELLYVVDHHHLLAALNIAGYDPVITLVEKGVVSIEERTLDEFWAWMEGKGFSFMRDGNYKKLPPSQLPTVFEIRKFRNDVYRSLGGFARDAGVLERGKTDDETFFFEFRWGYFFWLHRENKYNLWPDERLWRAFSRQIELLEQMDENEYKSIMDRGVSDSERAQVVTDFVFLSEEVILPSYSVIMFYLRHLCYAYDMQPAGVGKDVLGLKEIFSYNQLPGKVLKKSASDDTLVLKSNYSVPASRVNSRAEPKKGTKTNGTKTNGTKTNHVA